MLFKNATIYTMEQEPFVGDFKIDKGVFTEVGKNLTASEGEDVQDLNGLFVFPGLVESHCHLGMEETAIRFEGDDVNEITDPITPNMRGIDGCNPMDETIEIRIKRWCLLPLQKQVLVVLTYLVELSLRIRQKEIVLMK